MPLENLNTGFLSDTGYPLLVQPKVGEDRTLDTLFGLVSTQKDALYAELHRVGAILLRDFEVGADEEFEALATAIFPDLRDYRGGDSPRSAVGRKIYTSTHYPSDLSISMHNEMSFSRHFPRYLLFFCHTAPATGGATPLLDGRKMYRELDRDIVTAFESKKLTYLQNLHSGSGLGKSWQETFEEADQDRVEAYLVERDLDHVWNIDGGLRITETVDPTIRHPVTGDQVFFSQADQWHPSNLDPEVRAVMLQLVEEQDLYHNCVHGDGSPLDVDHLDEIRAYAEREKVSFDWQRGDVLLIDNILTMHGRTPFSGSRRVLLAIG